MELILDIASFAVLFAFVRELLLTHPGAAPPTSESEPRSVPSLSAASSPVLAGVGVLVCLYRGTYSLPWWLPPELGFRGDGGEPITLRFAIALVGSVMLSSVVFDRWLILRTLRSDVAERLD